MEIVILAAAVIAGAIIIRRGIDKMALNMERTNAALEALATGMGSIETGIADVAAAIRDPQVDNNSQAQVDALAGRLEAIAAVAGTIGGSLSGLADEERAMDTAEAVIEEPPVVEEPAPTPAPDTGTGDGGTDGTDDDAP